MVQFDVLAVEIVFVAHCLANSNFAFFNTTVQPVLKPVFLFEFFQRFRFCRSILIFNLDFKIERISNEKIGLIDTRQFLNRRKTTGIENKYDYFGWQHLLVIVRQWLIIE